jgi:superfamily II DNA/RNA helicase
VIIIQNFLLQSQLNEYLRHFREFGEAHKFEKLNFTVGILNNDGHTPGDIIVCMPKSFLNRHSRGNMKLDQCKFVAFDEIDQIYDFDKETLGQILKVVNEEKSSVIACSATMERHFMEFYKDISPSYIELNINADLEKETGQKITLEGVKNFYHVVEPEKGGDKDAKTEIFDYILNVVLKELYDNNVASKPQIFVFFNSIDDIDKFDKKFESLASDFTKEEASYLQNVTRASIGAKTYKDGKKQDLSHTEKEQIMTKFKNKETNMLLCPNIMARGVDIRNAVFVINACPPKKSDKDNDIDVDTYLHRVGRTGRYNDKGVALTIAATSDIEKLVSRVKKVQKIDIEKMGSIKEVIDEVQKCIDSNA